tara:strand:- start:670 stop:1227 length:558 start_codon:yes stop_codon:yes gene_type:complete
MRNARVTTRYAKALHGLAIENNSELDVYNDMQKLLITCSNNKELALFLKSPIIKTDKKLKILEHIFSKKISKISFLFLKIITQKKRESLLYDIASKFIEVYKKHNKIETASIITAQKLEPVLRENILKVLNNKLKEKIELNEVVDEKIIGGSIIRLGDKQLDSSVSSALKKLKHKFNKNLYIQDY